MGAVLAQPDRGAQVTPIKLLNLQQPGCKFHQIAERCQKQQQQQKHFILQFYLCWAFT